MNVTPEDLDSLLQAHAAGNGMLGKSTGASSHFDPALITESMKRFMDIAAGLEGAEFVE